MVKLKCMFGKHEFALTTNSTTTKDKMFLSVLEEMIPDSTSEMYDYVFRTLHEKHNKPDKVGNKVCLNCGKVRHDRILVYDKIVRDVSKKVNEFEQIQHMKRVADQLRCDDCHKG